MSEVIDILQIQELIPHRYPFLLIDKVIDLVSGESATGIKNVTYNEPFFQGHFPEKPVMPGVMIVEAMAQTAAVVAMKVAKDENINPKDMLVYFMTVDDCRFRKPVGPGDVLKLHVQKKQVKRNVWKFAGTGVVENKKVCEATFSAMMVDNS